MLARQKQAVGAIFLPLGRKKLQMAKGPAQFLRRESPGRVSPRDGHRFAQGLAPRKQGPGPKHGAVRHGTIVALHGV